MKKLLSALLALALCVTMSLTAFAANTQIEPDSDPQSGDIQVTFSVDPAYTVTIPATVELGQTATISAENVVVAYGSQVEVSLTGTSDASNAFTLTTAEGAVINYNVNKGTEAVSVGDTVLAVTPVDGSGDATLSFSEPKTLTYAGAYTSTITFTVAVRPTA